MRDLSASVNTDHSFETEGAAPCGAAPSAPEEETREPMWSHRSPRMKAASDTRDDVPSTYAAAFMGSMELPFTSGWDFRRAPVWWAVTPLLAVLLRSSSSLSP